MKSKAQHAPFPLFQAVFAVVTMIVVAACGVDIDSGQLLDAITANVRPSSPSKTVMPQDLRAA